MTTSVGGNATGQDCSFRFNLANDDFTATSVGDGCEWSVGPANARVRFSQAVDLETLHLDASGIRATSARGDATITVTSPDGTVSTCNYSQDIVTRKDDPTEP